MTNEGKMKMRMSGEISGFIQCYSRQVSNCLPFIHIICSWIMLQIPYNDVSKTILRTAYAMETHRRDKEIGSSGINIGSSLAATNTSLKKLRFHDKWNRRMRQMRKAVKHTKHTNKLPSTAHKQPSPWWYRHETGTEPPENRADRIHFWPHRPRLSIYSIQIALKINHTLFDTNRLLGVQWCGCGVLQVNVYVCVWVSNYERT